MDAHRFPSWTPLGFEDYRRIFPRTPDLPRTACDHSERFIEAWRSLQEDHRAVVRLRAQAAGVCAVFVRGLFGRWIPRHFTAPVRLLRRHGVDCMIARSRAAGTVEVNSGLLERDLLARAPAASRLVFLCHSKGGLDLLAMLEASAALRSRTHAIVLCQTPRDRCAILEIVLHSRHQDGSTRVERVKEGIANVALGLLRSRAACAELTGSAVRDRLVRLESISRSVRTIAVASWSREPTAWLDSQHERLGRVRPGCAHDGLFYTEDLIWPHSRQVLLPCVDHSQPGVGGQGFEHDYFWLALTSLALGKG